MFQSIIESTGTSLFAIIALLLFVAVFIVILFVTFSSRQSTIDQQARLPLDDDPQSVSDPHPPHRTRKSR